MVFAWNFSRFGIFGLLDFCLVILGETFVRQIVFSVEFFLGFSIVFFWSGIFPWFFMALDFFWSLTFAWICFWHWNFAWTFRLL